MNPAKFFTLLTFVAVTFIFTSCGGSEESKTDTTDTSKVNTSTPAATTPVNTIVTTPQNMMVITAKVADYSKWQPTYDARDSARLASGIHSYVIGRGLQDSNTLLIAMKIDDIEKAKAYAKDPGLKKAMQQGGVMGTPTISYYTINWQDTGMISFPLRSRTTFEVKDWDAWVKNFEMADGKQERADNGIMTRAYGHDIDNNKKVTLVTAVSDTARAFAYYKSDALKKRREAGGVIGEPKRFLYNIVKRY
jgi:hypothetical protein